MKTHLLLILTLFTWTFMARGQCQIPNADFESWTIDTTFSGDTYERPVNWKPFNSLFAQSKTPNITENNDGHSGENALELFTNSNGTGADIMAEFPCNMAYDNLSGYYRLTGSDDTISVQVYAFKWNTETDQSEPVGGGAVDITGVSENYSSFQVPLTMDQQNKPDTIRIIIDYYANADALNSKAIFDDLEFTNSVGYEDKKPENQISLYPNPAEEQININSNGKKIESLLLIDQSGRRLRQVNDPGSQAQIDVSGLNTGIYFIQMKNKEAINTRKVLIK